MQENLRLTSRRSMLVIDEFFGTAIGSGPCGWRCHLRGFLKCLLLIKLCFLLVTVLQVSSCLYVQSESRDVVNFLRVSCSLLEGSGFRRERERMSQIDLVHILYAVCRLSVLTLFE